MFKVKPLVALPILCILIFAFSLIYEFLTPKINNDKCEAIRERYEKIKIGMSKDEVISLINTEPNGKVYRHSGFFSEQKSEWEIWILCADLNSCITIKTGKKQCYKWQMLAFDTTTQKVIKIFSDDPEKIGFT